MTDRTELLAAVLAEPGCDAKRLIYADWLEDHGEVERAEWIRCDIAMSTPERNNETWKRIAWTNGRLAEWTQKAVGTWDLWDCRVGSEAWKLYCINLDMWVHWRRGFISTLRGPLAALLEHGPAIVREHPVERVEVTDPVIFPSGGNDTYYVGGLGRFPKEWWNRLDNHRTRRAAHDALNSAVLAELRRRKKETI